MKTKRIILPVLTLSILSLNSLFAINLPTLVKDYRGNGDIKTKKMLRSLFITNVNKSTNSTCNKLKRSSIGFTSGIASFFALERYIDSREKSLSGVICIGDKIQYSTKNIWNTVKYVTPLIVTVVSEKLVKLNQTNKSNYLALKDLLVNWNRYKPKIDPQLHYYFEDLVELYKNSPDIIKKYSTKIVDEIKFIL